MKDKLKGLLLGITIGSMVTGATAFAAGGKMIEVFYGVNDIKVNQVSKMPQGSNKPFLYNGTTFVPLAFVAQALGEPVKWDAKTHTVIVGKTGDVTAVYPGNGIEYMNYQEAYSSNTFNYEYDSNNPIKDNIGNTYSNFITLYVYGGMWSNGDNWSYSEFPLNAQYKNLKATVGLTEKFKNTTSPITLTIYTDETEVYKKTFNAGDMPTDIDLNVQGASKIKIKASNDGKDESEIGLFNAYFTK